MMRIKEQKGKNMLFIGITGGVGAGKSAVLDYLASIPGTRVLLADEIAHDLMEPGTSCYRKLYEIYGPEGTDPRPIYRKDGHFDRPATAKVIFGDEAQRKIFNGIVHPAVKQYVKDTWKEEQEKGELQLLVFECALLLEEHYDLICQECWYVYASEETRRKRLKESRGYSDAKIDSILKSQLSEDDFQQKCREKVDNDGSMEDTKAYLCKLLLARGIECGL